jgi:hypothetical protein
VNIVDCQYLQQRKMNVSSFLKVTALKQLPLRRRNGRPVGKWLLNRSVLPLNTPAMVNESATFLMAFTQNRPAISIFQSSWEENKNPN